MQHALSSSFNACTHARTGLFSRHSTAIAPWPIAGSMTSKDIVSPIRFSMTESFQTGAGKNDRIVIAGVEFCQTGIDIAAQRFDAKRG